MFATLNRKEQDAVNAINSHDIFIEPLNQASYEFIASALPAEAFSEIKVVTKTNTEETRRVCRCNATELLFILKSIQLKQVKNIGFCVYEGNIRAGITPFYTDTLGNFDSIY